MLIYIKYIIAGASLVFALLLAAGVLGRYMVSEWATAEAQLTGFRLLLYVLSQSVAWNAIGLLACLVLSSVISIADKNNKGDTRLAGGIVYFLIWPISDIVGMRRPEIASREMRPFVWLSLLAAAVIVPVLLNIAVWLHAR